MTDNGSAMISGEFTAGLHHLGILHLPTLPYSPFTHLFLRGELEGIV
jgi:putative transposase